MEPSCFRRLCAVVQHQHAVGRRPAVLMLFSDDELEALPELVRHLEDRNYGCTVFRASARADGAPGKVLFVDKN